MIQQESRLKVAEFLASHPKVTAVHYPGLASDPGYELARTQNPAGVGGVLSFQVATEEADLIRTISLGMRDGSSGVDASFRHAGAAHLLSVSGFHLVVVVGVFAMAPRGVNDKMRPSEG